jgi:hypothetical protein
MKQKDKINIFKNAAKAGYKSILSESDRGCVLVLASVFDEKLTVLLETAIKANLVGKKNADKEFYNDLFGLHGALGNFSGKIKVAYAFNLITADQYEAFEALRSVRNKVAHLPFDFTLKDTEVRRVLKRITDLAAKVDHEKLRKVWRVTDHGEKFELVAAAFQIHLSMMQGQFNESVRLMRSRGLNAAKGMQAALDKILESEKG